MADAETLPLTSPSNQRSERNLFPRGFDGNQRTVAQRDPKVHDRPKSATERPGVNQNAYQGKSNWVG